MLEDKILKTFIPALDLKKAKQFYNDILGLKFLNEDDYGLEFNANGTLLRVIIVPELQPQKFTVLGWNVPDIFTIISALKKKEILFERYDFLQQNEEGIWVSPNGSKVAWFKDFDGNLLSITELPTKIRKRRRF